MLFVLSPAKSLDFDTPTADIGHTKPLFVKQSTELIRLLREKSPQQVASLMGLSDKLAQLNVARYQAWRPRFDARNSKQAVLAFNGNVYGGLDAGSLSPEEMAWLQDHVCILSGLYGVLRPLDWMQPYRLEMGTSLENAQGENLYQFWGSQVSDYLNQRLRRDVSPVLVNLASKEYFKAVDLKALKARVIECVFEEYRGGHYKVLALHAKRARGLMARYAAQKGMLTPRQLEGFNLEGYAFDAAASKAERLVFRRRAS
jgi:uncharacterized protein